MDFFLADEIREAIYTDLISWLGKNGYPNTREYQLKALTEYLSLLTDDQLGFELNIILIYVVTEEINRLKKEIALLN